MDTITPDVQRLQVQSARYKIDDAWWDTFLKTTNHFTQTTVIPGAFSTAEGEEMKEMVLKAIREIYKIKTDNYGFRVYVDGKRENGDMLENEIFTRPPEPGEQAGDWAARLFPGKKFGMVINAGEKFSTELMQRLATYAAPLLQKAGIPLNGLHSTIFLGNYGLTPLGIHQDHRGANVIHFHLGPGQKTMYTWEEAHFTELLAGRKKSEVPVEEMLPHARQYKFGSGDIYFMPWNQFHIGNSDQFSIGVTIWFDNHVRRSVLSNLLDSIKLQYMNVDDLTITKPEKEYNELEGYADIEAMLNLPDYLREKPFMEFLEICYREYMLSLFSNEGWSSMPLSMEQEFGFDENDFEALSEKKVQLVQPFRMHYRRIDELGKMQVFVRGSKIELNYHPSLETLINALNEGTEYNTRELAEKTAPELPEEVVLYVLSLIYNRRGIEVR